MLAPIAMLGSSETASGPGPSGAPLEASFYDYAGGAKVGIEWRNGDPSSSTQVAFAANLNVFEDYPTYGEPTIHSTVPPGWTSRDLGYKAGFDYTYWAVRHVRNGQYSAWTVADYA